MVGGPVTALCFFSAGYSLNIYASSQQGGVLGGLGLSKSVDLREIIILSFHISPCVLMLGCLMLLISNINKYLIFVKLKCSSA